MRSIFISLMSLSVMAAPAFAQGNGPASCWELLAPPQGVAPASVLKLNRCTGETWLLVRTRLSEAKAPDINATYTFRWQRLMQDDTGEAVLATRAGPP